MRPYRRKTLAAGVPLNGKQKLLSFGAYPAVSLKDARAQRDEAKELLAKGIDPGEEKKERKAAQAAKEDVASGLTEALQPVRNTSLAALTDPKAVGALLRDIDACEGHFSVTYFLKILPYVFTRPSELRRAEWTEFDFDKELWRIPKERMKMRQEHSVPLARQVTALLRALQKFFGNGQYLFLSIRTQTIPISDAAPAGRIAPTELHPESDVSVWLPGHGQHQLE